MITRLLLLTIFTFSVSLQLSSKKRVANERELFHIGDHICYIGNSITANGDYHFLIDLYLRTRYPELHFKSFNCGISGNTAADVLKRLESDILIHQPALATIKLGMNDVNLGLYGQVPVSDDTLKLRKAALATYRQNLTKLAEKLVLNQCKPVFLTPTIYDQTAMISTANKACVNDALAECAGIVKEIAGQFKAPVVDFHTTLNKLNADKQAVNPGYSIIGNDRIHPGMTGNMVMAYTFLTTLFGDSLVSEIEIDAQAKLIRKSIHTRTAKLIMNPSLISILSHSISLPFPVMESAKEALTLVPFQQKLNQEILRVTNLEEASYFLMIDRDTIGTFTSGELEKGVNLADFENTPQYRQSLQVMEAAREKHQIESTILRNIAMVDYSVLSGKNIKNLNAIKQFLDPELEKIKDKSYYPWLKAKYADYLTLKPQEANLKRKIKQLENKIYTLNKTKIHYYRIIKQE